jgi:hypothetical protein
MITKSRFWLLFLVMTLTPTTCSATFEQGNQPQSPTPTLYLPIVTNRHPSVNIFGVDGSSSFAKMKSAGVSWLRVNAQLWWSDVETIKGSYDWSKVAELESKMAEAQGNGLELILLIQTAPEWAREYPMSVCGPIKDSEVDAFATFVGEVVRRYSQPPYNVKYYQIWNEPDEFVKEVEGGNNVHGCWAEEGNNYSGTRFGKMLSRVYPVFKGINPNAQLVMGSMMMICDPRNPNPEGYCAEPNWRASASFFEGVVKEAKDSFDVVMFNSGPSYKRGENPVWSEMNNWRWKRERGGLVNGKIEYLRSVMRSYGVERPIIHSEAYLLDRPDNPEDYNLFEEYKADYLVWVYANGWSQGLKAVTWYAIEGWKGSELINRDGSETKAFQALKTMTGFLKFADFISREDYEGFTKFVYRNGNEIIWLLIPTGQQYGTMYSIPAPSRLKRVVDLFGNDQTVSGSNIAFTRPVYIFINP